jgi:hypothetical protein
VNPAVSLLTSNVRFDSLREFPFELLGLCALVILFLMAATSHDFWLANLTPRTWKRLHMMVYIAYALLIGHVALGALQSESSPVMVTVIACGSVLIITLHLLAGSRERRIDEAKRETCRDGFVEVCKAGDIPEFRAKVMSVDGERLAIFRYDGKVSALSNVCTLRTDPWARERSSMGA